jgi:hypothetical protein
MANRKKTVAEIQNELGAGGELLPGLSAMANRDERRIPLEQARKKKYKKPQKFKRSYMLQEDTIQRLDDIRRVYKGKALSDLLKIAIDDLYEKNKAAIIETFIQE